MTKRRPPKPKISYTTHVRSNVQIKPGRGREDCAECHGDGGEWYKPDPNVLHFEWSECVKCKARKMDAAAKEDP